MKKKQREKERQHAYQQQYYLATEIRREPLQILRPILIQLKKVKIEKRGYGVHEGGKALTAYLEQLGTRMHSVILEWWLAILPYRDQ
jgi:hypothetical protein